MGLQELLAAAELSKKFTPSPELNNKQREIKEESSKVGRAILQGHKAIDELNRQ